MSEIDVSSPPHQSHQSKCDQFDFFDEHMENYDVETSALHRKLQSKIEALSILRMELEQFRTERDQFKLMAETLQLRYSAIKRNSDYNNGSKTTVANLLHETRERNIRLTTEVESLKQKLGELQGDIELLRSKECRGVDKTEQRTNDGVVCPSSCNKEEQIWKQERANFICYLENLKKKNAQLAFDFKAVIDEKEEIITERDAYKCKAHRLNHELFVALKINEKHPKFLDIDSIILENKYLQERIKNYENELDLTKQSMNKYKSMLDTKRKKGIIKLGKTNCEESILSHKQVKNILEHGIELPTKTETITDLKALCLTLLDNLNDKNIALSHQKKTNKILATKIAELEQRIQALTGVESSTSSCNSGFSPSQILLHGYCPAAVDMGGSTKKDEHVSTTKPPCNIHENSGTISSEHDESNKISGGPSDDAISLLSTESGRSVLSSEYGIDAGACSLSEFETSALYAYKTPSTTDSGHCITRNSINSNPNIPSYITKERSKDLKDLPPELAAMVQKALHELDMRDFDEVIGEIEDVDKKAITNVITSINEDEDEQNDEVTIHYTC